MQSQQAEKENCDLNEVFKTMQQKHVASFVKFVYKIKTRQTTSKFRLNIKNTLIKHYYQQKGKNRDNVPLSTMYIEMSTLDRKKPNIFEPVN